MRTWLVLLAALVLFFTACSAGQSGSNTDKDVGVPSSVNTQTPTLVPISAVPSTLPTPDPLVIVNNLLGPSRACNGVPSKVTDADVFVAAILTTCASDTVNGRPTFVVDSVEVKYADKTYKIGTVAVQISEHDENNCVRKYLGDLELNFNANDEWEGSSRPTFVVTSESYSAWDRCTQAAEHDKKDAQAQSVVVKMTSPNVLLDADKNYIAVAMVVENLAIDAILDLNILLENGQTVWIQYEPNPRPLLGVLSAVQPGYSYFQVSALCGCNTVDFEDGKAQAIAFRVNGRDPVKLK